MHPAYSVILFTTSSGAGYGLLFWVSIALMAGDMSHTHWSFFFTFALAVALITVGLLASTFHLGHPERAWRALSQWRSSWLSREGVAALATYLPVGLLGFLSLLKITTGAEPFLALLCALGAVATVWCTGMIYASLRTIKEWNLTLVPVIYLALGAASGGLLMGLMTSILGGQNHWQGAATLLALGVALVLKLVYYRHIDSDDGTYTAAQALGMGTKGIRQIDPPHTRPNYVMREMGYDVARRHALRLRWLGLLCLIAVPLTLISLGILADLPMLLPYLFAVMAAGIGLMLERWLFFAEATHVAILYYGAPRA
ncbi:dimethyl sulfoxide reductase anchor subunit family protein [Primorskyibacter flagellatus]|uniref:dimethyl sulfoxide reductase anchor subunit family protein n=1 Tax=Primorskyibacter flagellatus TaxID=1387277 RepID=UPI003A917A73